jgi:serine/threonine protein kinase
MPPDRPKPPSAADSALDSVDSFLREAAAISEPVSDEASAVTVLEAGEVVGERFRIERFAGSGGMGAVYRAADLASGAHAAIKVMGKQSGSVRERFSREAAVLAQLSHPCIVRYVAHGMTTRGLPFLAMDWLDGEDLSGRLARASLRAEDSLSLVRRASEGLAVAHARGVVHRDIKPSNLFLVDGDPGSAKVIDFGVARIDEGAGALTRPGTSLGTAGYMAPEQAMEAADVDARADVYALGCVLFECLTGRAPFVGRPAALLVKVLAEKPPRPSDLRPALSDEIDALLGRLLAKDRAERPRDAAELLRALDAIQSVVAYGPGIGGGGE